MSISTQESVSLDEQPPSFDDSGSTKDSIELNSVKQSKITNVSVYSGRAEVTRVFALSAKTGLNNVRINGLPRCMDQQSLRVEGRGATINDVTVSRIPQKLDDEVAAVISKLERQQQRASADIERQNVAIEALGTYIKSLDLEHVQPDKLTAALAAYDENTKALEDKVYARQDEVKELEEKIKLEKEKLYDSGDNDKLIHRVSVGVFAESEGQVGLVVIYSVRQSDWNALYDIRVNTQTKEKPVTLIYKAAIKQTTGESWNDVPLTLETATPSFGVAIPELRRWTVSKFTPQPAVKPHPLPRGGAALMSHAAAAAPSPPATMARKMNVAEVTSKGNVSATFEIPGTVTIPSDGDMHKFTIAELDLDADMTWVVVPKKDTKVHLKAQVVNASLYTFLAGSASVYVDGSFIARTSVPAVSPQEKFDCPLGLDPSVRVTYHPLEKKAAQSGFVNKTSKRSFTQRITLHNTKTVPITKFKVLDQFPVSEDSQIVVKHESPGLPQTTAPAEDLRKEVSVASGVTARWDGADDEASEAIGQDGRFYWQCDIPQQGKITLQSKWEVSAPQNERITGL